MVITWSEGTEIILIIKKLKKNAQMPDVAHRTAQTMPLNAWPNHTWSASERQCTNEFPLCAISNECE